jgi:hypothetical protein
MRQAPHLNADDVLLSMHCAGGGMKPATLETGAVVQVPLFIDAGQKIKVDTRSGERCSSAKLAEMIWEIKLMHACTLGCMSRI